jgi:hypothetical protein
MMLNVTFNIILLISWQSVLLVEETGVPGEATDLPQVPDKLDHMYLALGEILTYTFRDEEYNTGANMSFMSKQNTLDFDLLVIRSIDFRCE